MKWWKVDDSVFLVFGMGNGFVVFEYFCFINIEMFFCGMKLRVYRSRFIYFFFYLFVVEICLRICDVVSVCIRNEVEFIVDKVFVFLLYILGRRDIG